MVAELSKIKDKLLALLAENDRVTDIEKLERDEFVIDVTRKTKVMTEGEKECEDIRKEAEKTVLRLELLRNRVKQSTWDTMEF
jgi:ribosomal protein L15